VTTTTAAAAANASVPIFKKVSIFKIQFKNSHFMTGETGNSVAKVG